MRDQCGVCGGDGKSCLDCSGAVNGGGDDGGDADADDGGADADGDGGNDDDGGGDGVGNGGGENLFLSARLIYILYLVKDLPPHYQ